MSAFFSSIEKRIEYFSPIWRRSLWIIAHAKSDLAAQSHQSPELMRAGGQCVSVWEAYFLRITPVVGGTL